MFIGGYQAPATRILPPFSFFSLVIEILYVQVLLTPPKSPFVLPVSNTSKVRSFILNTTALLT